MHGFRNENMVVIPTRHHTTIFNYNGFNAVIQALGCSSIRIYNTGLQSAGQEASTKTIKFSDVNISVLLSLTREIFAVHFARIRRVVFEGESGKFCAIGKHKANPTEWLSLTHENRHTG
jgi:hypothetical protein